MPENRWKVFLDANVVVQAGKPPGGPIMSRVADLVRAELIEILTTDLTVKEVAKKHAENDYEVIKEVGRLHFRKVASEHLGTNLPEVSKAELRTAISAKYAELVTLMFSRLRSKTLPIDDIKPSTVFAAYAEGSGFFTGEGKKDQFPDAFIFERLKAEASAESPVIIVSNDGDFEPPLTGVKNISLLRTIPELFQALGLQEEAPEIGTFLEANADKVLGLAANELGDWGLFATDAADAEIEVIAVTNVELADLISFRSTEEGGSILAIGTAEIRATVAYTHPDWDNAMYDSEDKVLVPFDDVSGETEVTLNADFSMSIIVDGNGEPAEIEDFRFRNDDFVFVELYPIDL